MTRPKQKPLPLAVGLRNRIPPPMQEDELHNASALIPVPLFLAVKEELKGQRRNIRELIEWGFKEYLARSNPDKAREMGILAMD